MHAIILTNKLTLLKGRSIKFPILICVSKNFLTTKNSILKEKIISTEPGFKPGAARWKQECFLCATQTPNYIKDNLGE